MLVTGVTVVLSLFVCSLAAFAFVFMKWRGRDLVLAVIIATLIVPFETIAIPMLIVVNNLPWIGERGRRPSAGSTATGCRSCRSSPTG